MILPTQQNSATWALWSAGTWGALATTQWGAAGVTYVWLVYHLRSGQWTKWVPAAAANIGAWNFQSVLGPLALKGLYIGSRFADGKLYQYREGASYEDIISAYDCIVETKDNDFGEPNYAKRGMWITVEGTGTNLLTLYNIPDSNELSSFTVSLNPGSRITRRKPGPGFFRTWRVRMVATTSYGMTLYGFTLAMTPRRQMLKTQ